MTPWTAAHQLLYPEDFPGKNTAVGSHFLLQGIFLTQGSNPGLLQCRWILYCLSQQGSPAMTYAANMLTDPTLNLWSLTSRGPGSYQAVSMYFLCSFTTFSLEPFKPTTLSPTTPETHDLFYYFIKISNSMTSPTTTFVHILYLCPLALSSLLTLQTMVSHLNAQGKCNSPPISINQVLLGYILISPAIYCQRLL